MELNQIREKIEEIFPKYKHHWFELMEDGTTDVASEKHLIGIMSQEILRDLNSIKVFRTQNFKTRHIKKLISELQKKMNDRNEVSDSQLTYAVGKMNVDHILRDAENVFGFSITRYQPQIDFWKWYLSELEQPEPPAAEIPADVKPDPTAGETGSKNPLSVLSQRQLALWVFYRQHPKAGEMEDFENMVDVTSEINTKKKAIFSFAEKIPKKDGSKRAGQRFEDEWRALDKEWKESKYKNFEAPTKNNLDDHRAILNHLDRNSKAYQLAQNTIDKIEQNLVTP